MPRGDDGEPLPIDLRVSASPKSAVYTLEARSAHPAYTQAYLDALMDVYLEYKKESRKLVSGESLNSITELVQRAQRDLTAEQDSSMPSSAPTTSPSSRKKATSPAATSPS